MALHQPLRPLQPMLLVLFAPSLDSSPQRLQLHLVLLPQLELLVSYLHVVLQTGVVEM